MCAIMNKDSSTQYVRSVGFEHGKCEENNNYIKQKEIKTKMMGRLQNQFDIASSKALEVMPIQVYMVKTRSMLDIWSIHGGEMKMV